MRFIIFVCIFVYTSTVYCKHIKSSSYNDDSDEDKVTSYDDDDDDGDGSVEDSNTEEYYDDFELPSEDEETLLLVNVLFRHGNRTANGKEELYPHDPNGNFNYFPYGLGQLTKAGKLREYSIGTALRDRYDYFLGDHYYPDIVEARSTDYNRTKMSLQLVLAGLFPPQKEDIFSENLNLWQPVPFNYAPKDSDFLLLGAECSRYKELYDQYTKSPDVKKRFKKNKNIFDYISRKSGREIKSFLDVYNLYFGISTQLEYGLTLPSWLKYVWPEKIVDMAIKEYNISMGTKSMRKILAGTLLQKIITDMKHKLDDTDPLGRKIFLYSAHESNLAHMMIALGVFDGQIPNYGAYLIVEFHKIDDQPGVKIFYQNYYNQKPKLLTIPHCKAFCPLNKFVNLMKENLPKPKDKLCKFKEN